MAAIEKIVTSDSPLSLNDGHIWAFIHFAIVGFVEELLFRGYLQSRLEVWLGTLRGWLVASLIMALAHIGQRIAVEDLGIVDALFSSMALISISLFLGFVYLRTRNVVAPGIAHTMGNWLTTF